MMLATNAQLVADVLRADEESEGRVMRAIAATRSLESIVGETLRALVQQARADGHTWAEIGELLHVSRQAAFQRFGPAAHAGDGTEAVATPVDGAIEHALPVLEAFLDERFEDVQATFGERMEKAVSLELLADVRERVRRHAGEVQALGTPVVSVRDGYTIVDVPVSLERGDGVARIVLDGDRRVAGFLVRPAEAGL